MSETDAGSRFRDVLGKNGIGQPFPGKTITEARWLAAQNDWWVLIEGQWYWWNSRVSEWMPSTHGP